jgi:tRNA1(Val) A37 N6-methylase TrmN6
MESIPAARAEAAGFPAAALSDDALLGGRVRLWQPRSGFRATSDAVFLAAAVPARSGQRVLELGCGTGAAFLCLAARVPGLALAAVELQRDYAELARANAARNAVAAEVHAADLADLPPPLRRGFDHVIANPPFHAAGDGTPAADTGREAALREATPVSVWLAVAARRLVPGGTLTLIHAADRLPDVLAALPATLGSVAVLPLAARADRPAGRVLLRARKGGRAPFRLLAPLVLHAGAAHVDDRADDHTPAARAVLREGAAISAIG